MLTLNIVSNHKSYSDIEYAFLKCFSEMPGKIICCSSPGWLWVWCQMVDQTDTGYPFQLYIANSCIAINEVCVCVLYRKI